MKLISVLGATLLLAGESWLASAAANCGNVAVTAIPSCAQSCFLSGAPSVGCAAADFACQCEKEARLYAAIEGCVSDGCPSASYQAVIDGASSVCDCATGLAGQARAMGSMTVVPGSSFASSPATATATGSSIPPASTKTSLPSPTASGTPAATTTASSSADRRLPAALSPLAGGLIASYLLASLF